MQAEAERSITAHTNPCQASVVLRTHPSGTFSPPPLLSNVDTTSEGQLHVVTS